MVDTNPYIPVVDKFKGSREFSYLAEFFDKHGVYTHLPAGTVEYKKFWEDVKEKCLVGFTNELGISISAHHFFYLNFCRIEIQNLKTKKKIEGFPRFTDLDYEYFHMIDYCRKNEKSFIGVKGRRQGFSYKAGAICTHEFLFFPKSRSIIGAFLDHYSSNTMAMTITNLNFLNTNTEFRKQRNPDLKDYITARYQVDVAGVKVWKGLNSTVQSITFKDSPQKAAGKSASWLVLDESGLFPNITETYGYTEPLIKDGSTYTGTAIIQGSSGNMDSGSKYFYEMFTNPAKYNMLEFKDPENEERVIGFFSSALKARQGICKNPKSKWYKQYMIDDEGNSNYEAALDDILFEREKSKGGNDRRAAHFAITQFPLTWKEAFLRDKGTVFASIEMFDWLSKLETLKSLSEDKKKGTFYFDEQNKIKFRLDPDLQEIINYPMDKSEDKRGCVIIYEDPIKDPPHGLYIAGCDPYDQDKADSSESLGSIYVYKRFISNNVTHDQIVAEFTGRPEKADDFYETCRRLCIYYNAKCLYENQLKGLKVYFEHKNSLHFLCEQPEILKDIVKNTQVRRGYGIHMLESIKDQAEIYLKDWLYTERDLVDGTKILNLHTIKSIGLLKELIAYDRECNTDRVIALFCIMLQCKEMHRLHLTNNQTNVLAETDAFFKRKLFVKHNQNKFRYN